MNNARRIRALVMAPTRELVVQIEENVRAYAKHLPLRIATVYGGVGEHPQIRALREGADIVIATPGRLLDLMGQRYGDFSGVEFLVLDEADRMLDMGFLPPIRAGRARLAEATADAALLRDVVEGDRRAHARISARAEDGANWPALESGRNRHAICL